MAALFRSLRRLTVVPHLRQTAHFRQAMPALMYSSSTKPDEGSIPTDLEQATGLEKKELDAHIAGIEDPFNMKVREGPKGTKASPTMVPSMFEERIVGCICDEDTTFIQWMALKKGPPQRCCNCGHWFQLTPGNPIKI